MENIILSFIYPFLLGVIAGAMLWEFFWNKVLTRNNDAWYDLGYKHGKQRGDADAFFEEVYQQHKD